MASDRIRCIKRVGNIENNIIVFENHKYNILQPLNILKWLHSG